MENAVLVGDNASTLEVYDWVTKEKTTSFPAFSGTVKCAVGHPTAQQIVVRCTCVRACACVPCACRALIAMQTWVATECAAGLDDIVCCCCCLLFRS